MSRKHWIIVGVLALAFGGMFAYGLIAGDVGYVFKIAYENLCFS